MFKIQQCIKNPKGSKNSKDLKDEFGLSLGLEDFDLKSSTTSVSSKSSKGGSAIQIIPAAVVDQM